MRRSPGRDHIRDDTEPAAALLLHLEADELEHVVLTRPRGRQVCPGNLEPRTAWNRAVEPDHEPAARVLALLDADLLAPARRTAPGSKRFGSSLACSTTNDPSRPCGLPTRPT